MMEFLGNLLESALGTQLSSFALAAGLAWASGIRLYAICFALGMAGQEPLAIDLSPLPADAIVYDIVYAPLVTDLIAQAEDRGLATIDGLEMLVGQAALAFELLFGAAPPREHDEELREILLA